MKFHSFFGEIRLKYKEVVDFNANLLSYFLNHIPSHLLKKKKKEFCPLFVSPSLLLCLKGGGQVSKIFIDRRYNMRLLMPNLDVQCYIGKAKYEFLGLTRKFYFPIQMFFPFIPRDLFFFFCCNLYTDILNFRKRF